MSTSPGQHVGFNTPFQAQIDYLVQKLRVPTERWDDIQRSAHDRAFMVAGATKADLLQDLHDAVVQRATDGKGLKQFQKDFKAIVQKHGWTGWTGEGSKEGVAWRTKVIYQTNMAHSYAAGRYRQMTDPDYVRLRPYWRYIHREGVRHPRPQHMAWHGLTLRHDHPFWQSHYPPNGWGCGCRIAPVGKAEGERSRDAGLGDPPDGWDATDPKTGAPAGIDKGFDYAPGATWHPNLDKYPQPLARQMVDANLKDGVFERWMKQVDTRIANERALPKYDKLPKSQVNEDIRRALASKERIPLAVLDDRGLRALNIAVSDTAESGFATQTVWLSDDTTIKQALHHTAPELPAGSYLRLQHALDGAQYVESKDGAKLIYLHHDGDWAVAVIKATSSKDELFLVSMHKSSQRAVDAAVKSGKATPWPP